jgi:hypothetical protein
MGFDTAMVAFGHQIDMNRKDAKVAKYYYSWRLEQSGR